MDEWMRMFLNGIFSNMGATATSACQQKQEKEQTWNPKTVHGAYEVPKPEHQFIYSILNKGPAFLGIMKYSKIQEGEFTEIEDTETGEIAVGELADQTSDRGEAVLDHEGDESGV